MSQPFELQWGEVKRSINAMQERLANPKPVLREFSKGFSDDIKANIEAGGTGWPPKAASTLKREESTGTSQVSKRGTIRADRVKKTASAMKKLERKVRDQGWTPENRKKHERLKKRLANYKKAELRAKKKDASKRNIGKRVSEKGGPLLKRIPGTIRSKIDKNVLVTYSKADEVGAAHDYGEGRTPKREFLPPPDMERQLDRLANLLESDLGQAWETGKGR
jgi:hypothetical protein